MIRQHDRGVHTLRDLRSSESTLACRPTSTWFVHLVLDTVYAVCLLLPRSREPQKSGSSKIIKSHQKNVIKSPHLRRARGSFLVPLSIITNNTLPPRASSLPLARLLLFPQPGVQIFPFRKPKDLPDMQNVKISLEHLPFQDHAQYLLSCDLDLSLASIY